MFKGSMVALVTPFKEGNIDEAAFQALVDWQVTSGTHGLVPCGTTGENSTMSEEEHCHVIDLCIEAAAGRAPVIAGTGSNATGTAVKLAQHAEKSGADAILVVTPYYNKPTQEGLYQHYKTIHDNCGLPIILYSVPSRTGVEISVDTVARLAKLPRIKGIKDAHTDLARPLQMRLVTPDDFSLISGEDATIAAYLAQGGHGCISVTANVAPKECADMHNAWMAKDWDTFETLRDRLLPLHKALFVETSPAPAKYALSRLGRGLDEMRLPLVPASESCRAVVDAALDYAGLLNKKAA